MEIKIIYIFKRINVAYLGFPNKNKNICLVLCFLCLCFFIVINIPINTDLTPDSKLYYGLSNNIKNGTGYYDNIRNDEILPPVGHPLLLLIFNTLTKDTTIVEVFIGLLALIFSIMFYTGSVAMTLVSCGFLLLILRSIGFLNYGIEASIFMVSSLLVLSFVYMYKKDLSIPSLILSSFLVALHILIRPLLFYPVVLFVLILVVCIIYRYIKYKTLVFYSRNVKKLLIVSLLVMATIGSISVVSLACYRDKRLTNGTYSSIPLYVANNEYIPIDRAYSSNMLSEYVPKEKIDYLFSCSDGWEKRQSRLFSEVTTYIYQSPKRAVSGWIWRFNRYMGADFNVSNKLFIYTAFIYLNFLLILSLIIACVVKKNYSCLLSSLALLISTLLIVQIFQMMLFVWVGRYRYLITMLPFLVAGVLFSLFEFKNFFNFKEN